MSEDTTLNQSIASFKRLQEIEALIGEAEEYINRLKRERSILRDITTSPMLTCTKCKHQWSPRNNKPPKICPNCKTRNWHLSSVPKVK